MKVVILAGGFGTRISEESATKPKPMINIGEQPILWHIMKYYSSFGFDDFIICLGYKQYIIKEYFANYFLHTSDVKFDLSNNNMEVLNHSGESWKVTLVDTGLNTMTGGRIKRVRDYIDGDNFMLTYGDGLCDVDLNKELDFHLKHRKLLTLTTVSLASAKGVMELDECGVVKSFREKSIDDGALINGGFMICNKKIIDYIAGDNISFEKEPFNNIVKEGEMVGFRHDGFWQCMDTQREMKYLNDLWDKGIAPWKRW